MVVSITIQSAGSATTYLLERTKFVIGIQGRPAPDTKATTGTIIAFTKPLVYNTPALPGTGNISNDLEGAKIGIRQKIYHTAGAGGIAPTVPAGWVLMGGEYLTDPDEAILNVIFAEWVSESRVEYYIYQPS